MKSCIKWALRPVRGQTSHLAEEELKLTMLEATRDMNKLLKKQACLMFELFYLAEIICGQIVLILVLLLVYIA